jgi:hypothetical protein
MGAGLLPPILIAVLGLANDANKRRLNPDIHPVITRPTLVFSSIAATSCIYSCFYYSPLLLINYMRCLPSSIFFLFKKFGPSLKKTKKKTVVWMNFN